VGERYVVVSCHVERPLDDAVWTAFARLQASRPGGLRIAALMRPPDAAAGEDAERWLARAHEAAARAPFGHHTHFGGPDDARPPDGVDPAARVRAEAVWLRSCGLEPRFYCGGGWYMDGAVAAEVARAGYVDCSAVAFPVPWLGPGDPYLRLGEPARLDANGSSFLELPTTHSAGAAARSLARLPDGVHVHFHDWELVDRRRRVAVTGLLHVLARLRPALDLERVAALVGPEAPHRPLASVLRV
jgi:hypothetical protein